jgi:TP901 family phage tail tape measure protein
MAGDFLPPVVAQLLASTGEYNAKMDEATGRMEAFGKSSDKIGTKVAGLWNKMSTYAIAGAVGVTAVAAKMAYDYNDALDSMFRTTNLNADQQAYLKKAVLDVSTATTTTATTIVSGETQLLKAGDNLHQSLIDVGQAAKYTQAMGGNLNDTLTAAIGIQKQHIAGSHSMAQTLDIFTTAEKNSQLTAEDLNTALSGRALSAFSAYKVDLRSAVTILAGFADQNLRGSRSTMVLKTGLAALEKPAETAKGKLTNQAKAIASVGLNMTTLADEVRKPGGMLMVLNQLSTAFNTNASAAMKAQGIAAFMQQIFGTSAGPAFTNLLTELPKLMQLYDKMSTSKGATNTAFAEWLKSPQGAFEKFKTTLENSIIRIGDVVLPKLTVGLIDATKLITDIAGNKTETSLIGDVVKVVLGGAIATKLIQGILAVAGGLGVKAVVGAGAGELAATAAGAGFDAAAGIAAFYATTEALRHNLFGLGTAVQDTIGRLLHAAPPQANQQLAPKWKSLLGGYGADSSLLTPSDIRYLLAKQGGINGMMGQLNSRGAVNVNHRTTVRLR